MRRGTNAMLISLALVMVFPATAFATETPSSRPSSSVAPSVHSLTQAQKDSVAAARAAFVIAKKDALEGFDRAIADAQAIRDQAIVVAGSEQSSIRLAKKNYRASYGTILNAYRSDLKSAKLNFAKALAAVRGSSKIR